MIFCCYFQFPDEIENTQSLREETSAPFAEDDENLSLSFGKEGIILPAL